MKTMGVLLCLVLAVFLWFADYTAKHLTIEVEAMFYEDISSDTLRNVTLRYPQISGLKNIDFQRDINRKLNPLCKEGGDDDGLYMNTWFTHDVIADRIISFRIYTNIHRAGVINWYPELYAVAIDIETENALSLTDVIFVDDRFKNLFLNGHFSSPRYEDDLTEWILADNLYDNIYGLYLTDSHLGVIVSVCRVAGGYLELEIPYAEIGDLLKPEFKPLLFVDEDNLQLQIEPLNDTIEHPFFGVWCLNEVAFSSLMYNEDVLEYIDYYIIDGEKIHYYVEDYLGYELEYAPTFFRFGDQICREPEYATDYISVASYISSGVFERTYPSFHSFIGEKGIEIDGEGEYKYLDIPLLRFEITFSEDLIAERIFPPIGTQCVLLNNDNILVGTWGKILLAQRVS